MTTIVALAVVGAASLAFRLVPLLGAARVPEAVTRVAGWAGLGVLVAITVRAVAHHEDPGLPVPALVAAVAVGCGLVVARRGRPVPVVLLCGSLVYAATSLLVTGLVRVG